MIICAAIKFQIIKTGREVILCGLRHGDIFSQMADMGLRPHSDYIEICQGFIDNKNNFLDRYEAFEHARNVGQISMTTYQSKIEHHELKLYSEDLY